jgi:hypothetical protein
MTCDAPRLLTTTERFDSNPVVGSDVSYDHGQWQVLHHLASGAVVARGDQYSIEDTSHGDVTQWAGYYRRDRTKLMSGKAWVDMHTGEGGYDEQIINLSRGGRVEMHSVANCRIDLGHTTMRDDRPPVVAREPDIVFAQQVFQVPRDISGGHLNIRNGPGVNYALIGAIPAGTIMKGPKNGHSLECRPREDGIKGADWCHVGWNGAEGWVSRAGLMPLSTEDDNGDRDY